MFQSLSIYKVCNLTVVTSSLIFLLSGSSLSVSSIGILYILLAAKLVANTSKSHLNFVFKGELGQSSNLATQLRGKDV